MFCCVLTSHVGSHRRRAPAIRCAWLGSAHPSTVTRRGAADRPGADTNQDQTKYQRPQIPQLQPPYPTHPTPGHRVNSARPLDSGGPHGCGNRTCSATMSDETRLHGMQKVGPHYCSGVGARRRRRATVDRAAIVRRLLPGRESGCEDCSGMTDHGSACESSVPPIRRPLVGP